MPGLTCTNAVGTAVIKPALVTIGNAVPPYGDVIVTTLPATDALKPASWQFPVTAFVQAFILVLTLPAIVLVLFVVAVIFESISLPLMVILLT